MQVLAAKQTAQLWGCLQRASLPGLGLGAISSKRCFGAVTDAGQLHRSCVSLRLTAAVCCRLPKTRASCQKWASLCCPCLTASEASPAPASVDPSCGLHCTQQGQL